MRKEVILGGIAGAAVILILTLLMLLVIDNFITDFLSPTGNILVGFLVVVLAHIAGGFLAGLLAHPDQQFAGFLAGLIAGLVMVVVWLFIVGISSQTIMGGLIVLILWIILAWAGSAFTRHSKKS
jgi:hypothetical protein